MRIVCEGSSLSSFLEQARLRSRPPLVIVPTSLCFCCISRTCRLFFHVPLSPSVFVLCLRLGPEMITRVQREGCSFSENDIAASPSFLLLCFSLLIFHGSTVLFFPVFFSHFVVPFKDIYVDCLSSSLEKIRICRHKSANSLLSHIF